VHRSILHVDQNCFYASCELAEHPELRGKPLVVGGDEELRHGIVLTKSQEAKAFGIKTAETLWQARRKCPGLIVVKPNYSLYMRYAAEARRIYYDYTDLVEPFGADEAWLDVTGSAHLNGGVAFIAREISERVRSELGLSVSIGISWNKVFAKFGSDYKKPDAITAIDEGNYRKVVWEAPVGDLLFVGQATAYKLSCMGIKTIGDLAAESPRRLSNVFGKVGGILQVFAQGKDDSPVKPYDIERGGVDRTVKSFGNGLTAPHDIEDPHDAKALVYLLSESVAQRMREGLYRARTISIAVRDAELHGYTRQAKLQTASNATSVVASAAWELLRANEPLDRSRPLRSLSVRASDLVPSATPVQLSLWDGEEAAKRERLDASIDDLRRRFGNTCVQRGIELYDKSLANMDIKRDNVVHPVGYFHV